MKLSALTLAAALAFAGSAAFAATTTVDRTTQVGPNGEVTHVVKRTENPDGSTRTVHKVRRVTHVTTPVVVHRKVVHYGPHHRHHHAKYAFTRNGKVHYASSPRPRHNNS